MANYIGLETVEEEMTYEELTELAYEDAEFEVAMDRYRNVYGDAVATVNLFPDLEDDLPF